MKIKPSIIFSLISLSFLILSLNLAMMNSITSTIPSPSLRPENVLVSLSTSSQTLWKNLGIEICTENYAQDYPQVCCDASGAIFVWSDHRNNIDDNIYAQKVDPNGNILWEPNGTLICNASLGQYNPQICCDGTGGAIIVWEDFRSGTFYDIYAQSVNSQGQTLWTPNGTVICNASRDQNNAKICCDGSGGAIITWVDDRDDSTTSLDIYAQKINSSGSVEWLLNGTPICNLAAIQSDPVICCDGAGSAIIAWNDQRNLATRSNDIFAQKVDAAGNVKWTTNGTGICNYTNTQSNQRVCCDGTGGAFFTWIDYRNSNNDIFAQRVNSSGIAKFAANGTVICNELQSQSNPDMCCDGSGNAIITWHDLRNGLDNNIYAQKITSEGAILWTSNGTLVANATGNQVNPKICCDGRGGAFIIFQSPTIVMTALSGGMRAMAGYPCIYAQHVGAGGTTPWGRGGKLVGSDTNAYNHQICCDGLGNAYVTWTDDRNGNDDVFAQKLGELPAADWGLLLLLMNSAGQAGLGITIGMIAVAIAVGVGIFAVVMIYRRR